MAVVRKAAESRGCLTELIDMIISHYFIVSYLFHHSKIKRVTAQLWQTPSVIMKFDDRPPPFLSPPSLSLSFSPLLSGTLLQASNSSGPRRCLPMIKDLYCVCARRKPQQLLSLPNPINSLARPFNDWYIPPASLSLFSHPSFLPSLPFFPY
ncbi:hypothetical protein AMECASPLE_010668 [Ameca splendens]|uniref:Uncharacterized protein n=1 Tax=Ameca splendens TaxID=208324 RepID=A0ABV0YZ84_9TELE